MSQLTVHKPQFTKHTLTCTYSIDGDLFTNTLRFPEPTTSRWNATADKLADWLAIVSGFGFFNLIYFDEVVADFPLSVEECRFFERLLFHGLGEFRLVNHIPITQHTRVYSRLPSTAATPLPTLAPTVDHGPLLMNGGGKDGSVSAYLLNQAGRSFTWFQRGNSAAQANVVAAWEAPLITIHRQLDTKRRKGPYRGHRPISAGLAFTALLTAHLLGYSAVIVSNEASAQEGNMTIDGFTVNHQYSKSLAFETDLQHLLGTFGVTTQYFSLLRPLHELQISAIATHLTNAQLRAITSCNHGTKDAVWCMRCAKCAFVVLAVTAANPGTAGVLWGDRGTINRPALRDFLVALLDPAVPKPLECVGTLAECQLAAYLICTRHADILTPETLDLFKKYTVQLDQTSLTALTQLESSAIPASYQPVLQPAEEILKVFAQEA